MHRRENAGESCLTNIITKYSTTDTLSLSDDQIRSLSFASRACITFKLSFRAGKTHAA